MSRASRGKARNKYLTTNFIGNEVMEAGNGAQFSNWVLREGDSNSFKLDVKNDIYCMHPTFDYTCYYNYLVYLNQIYPDWTNYGLLDQKYKPYIYMPSFWTNKIDSCAKVTEQLLSIARRAGVSLKTYNAISFTHGSAFGKDYWIHRTELPKILDYIDTMLAEHGISAEGPLSTGTRDITKVSMTQVLRVFSNLEAIERGAKVH